MSTSQINFIFLFAASYAYMDWYYDESSIKWAKLALAILATPPALLSIGYLIRMRWYCLVFLANQTVEAITLGFLSTYFDYFDDAMADIERIYDKVTIANLYHYIMHYDDESWVTFCCEAVMYVFGGSMDGQCCIVKRITQGHVVLQHAAKEFLDTVAYGPMMKKYDPTTAPVMDDDWTINIDSAVINGKACVLVAKTPITDSYTEIKRGNAFFLTILKRNNPKCKEFKFSTVMCVTKDENSPMHLHVNAAQKWHVNLDCSTCHNFTSEWYRLKRVHEHRQVTLINNLVI